MSENNKPRSPKPKDGFSALFQNREQEEAFHQWRRDNAERLKAFNESTDTIKSLLYAISEFWYERVNEGWQDTIDLVHQQSEFIDKLNAEIPEAVKRGQLAATLANWDAIQAKQKRLVTLNTRARPAAIKKRRRTAEKNNADLDKAISDLLENHPHAKSWTNDDIVDWLAPRHPVYKPSTILQRVKKIAAEIRKKDRQNRKLPNR